MKMKKIMLLVACSSLRRKGQKMEKNSVNYKYLVRSPRDIDWGITVDTVGSEPIPPNYPVYPPRTGHPDAFYFTPSRGRVLDSYQLLYITHGKGYFYTSPDTFIEIKEIGKLLRLKNAGNRLQQKMIRHDLRVD
jgi:hypothetical protein